MSDSLPRGWAHTTIKELAGTTGLFVDGDWVESKDQDPNGNIRLLQLADIGDGAFLDKSNRWINEDAFERLRCTALNTGDVLVARMPDPLGRACLMPTLEQRCVTVVDVAALRVDSKIADNRWAMHTVNSPQIRAEISAQSSGTTRKRISRGKLGEMEIPLPPKAEQTRIADQLDKLLARVQDCNNRLDAIPALLKRFRQAVLAVATSGRLTSDWREEQGIADVEWPTVTVESIAETVFDGPFGSHLKSADYSDEGIRVVRLENIGALQFFADKQTFIPDSKYATLQRHTLKKDDVLFSSFVDEEVRVCIYPADEVGKAINKADVFCIRTDRQLCNPSFLALRLGCKTTYVALRKQVHGATRPRINLTQIRGFEIGLPSLSEQAEIVRRVEALFQLADRIETRCSAACVLAQRASPLLLAKAFRGELVPQDPNDEPASALLERISAEREKATTQPRPRKSSVGRKPVRAPNENAFTTKGRIIGDMQGRP